MLVSNQKRRKNMSSYSFFKEIRSVFKQKAPNFLFKNNQLGASYYS